MALQSKLVFEVEGIEQKSFDVIDSKLVLDRTYDSLSPTGPTHMETLEVTLYPELEDNYFHRWFMEKTKQDVILKILLPSSSRGKELYHHIYLEDAVCYTLFESIERLNDKEEGRRRLLKIGIKAKSVGIRRPKTFKAQAQTQNQAQSKDQKNAKKTTAAKKNQSLEDLLTIRERADKWPGNLSKEEKMKLAENSIEIERSLNIAKGKPMSIEEADEQKANPKRIDPEDSAFVEARDRKYTINCATCSTAYVLRKRGFDVKAKGWVKDTSNSWLSDGNNVFKKWKTVDGQECKMSSFRDWMGEKRVFKMTPELYREFLEEQTQEEGTYILACSWPDPSKPGKFSGGHATIVERWRDEKGNLHLSHIEPQVYDGKNSKRDINQLCLQMTPWPDADIDGIMRVDDKIYDVSHHNDLFEYTDKNKNEIK